MTTQLAFFIISCAKNTQVVSLLIDSIHQFGPETPHIYVSTDGPMPQLDQSDATIIISTNMSFGDRMRDALAQVPSDQVIVMCDDFIVEGKMNTAELQQLSQTMTDTPNIASIALAQISGENTQTLLHKHYIKRTETATFKTTLQCGLWRKNVLLDLMKHIPSPWEFELFANHKTYYSGFDYYALTSDANMPIPYNRGKLIIRGHVVLPEKARLEQVLGQPIDLSDFPTTNSYDQGRTMTLAARLKRRLKLELSAYYHRVRVRLLWRRIK